MPDGKRDSNERPAERQYRTLLRISSVDENSTAVGKPPNDRPSVFSWKDESCWSVSENTKSRDFRRKRFKKQKGEYLATKEPPPEILQEISKLNEEQATNSPGVAADPEKKANPSAYTGQKRPQS
ncbi:hypothetical protein CRM22_005693 [Opisthorchis felineus]|uniref:Uncharacterized protein n=1 Tax=Opisthorchis felineus TaxID=147828 RepID=A0A4S2LPW2_OPIFE|nr:hypothetical protein CRM22_005693 [Opisthorchis felineus]